MANGGRFHCVSCIFNESVSQLRRAPDKEQTDELFNKMREDGYYCGLRQQYLKGDGLETICHHHLPHWDADQESIELREKNKSFGHIYYKNPYRVSIPWAGNKGPVSGASLPRFICNGKTDIWGITIKLENGENLSFCGEKHYVRWWKTVYNDESIKEDDYPESD